MLVQRIACEELLLDRQQLQRTRDVALRPFHAALRLHALRERRDNSRVAELRQKLENVARTKENTLPVIQECVESYVTLGEICSTLASVFGEQKETVVF